MNENNETPAVGEVPQWHSMLYSVLYDCEDAGDAAAIRDSADEALSQITALRALVGELADGLALVEKLEEIKDRQISAVGRRKSKFGIAINQDAEALEYQSLDLEAGEITDQIATLIAKAAKAKEAGL